MSNINKIPPSTSPTAGKRKTTFQPTIPGRYVLSLNSWRKEKSHGVCELQGINGREALGVEGEGGEDTEPNGQFSNNQVEHGSYDM
jgi:hypothetical protein